VKRSFFCCALTFGFESTERICSSRARGARNSSASPTAASRLPSSAALKVASA
jgi:hypothetical protein